MLTAAFVLTDSGSGSGPGQAAADSEAAMTVLMRPGGGPAALRDPADLPALEIKLVSLVVLLSVTLLFGFVPLCVVRAGGRCGADPGAGPVLFHPDSGPAG